MLYMLCYFRNNSREPAPHQMKILKELCNYWEHPFITFSSFPNIIKCKQKKVHKGVEWRQTKETCRRRAAPHAKLLHKQHWAWPWCRWHRWTVTFNGHSTGTQNAQKKSLNQEEQQTAEKPQQRRVSDGLFVKMRSAVCQGMNQNDLVCHSPPLLYRGRRHTLIGWVECLKLPSINN